MKRERVVQLDVGLQPLEMSQHTSRAEERHSMNGLTAVVASSE